MQNNKDSDKNENPKENQNQFAKKWNKKLLIAFFGIIVLAGAAFAGLNYINSRNRAAQDPSLPIAGDMAEKDTPPRIMEIAATAIGDIAISPAKYSQLGVELDSDFIIKTKEAVTREQLLTNLSVKSGETFTIEPAGNPADQAFLLSFQDNLEYDRIYNFEYSAPEKHPLSFAFQTVSTFHVVSTMPVDGGYTVPVNTGIEVTFNDEIIGNFEDYFKIEPHVEGKFDKVGNTHIFVPEILEYAKRYVVTIKSGIRSKTGEVLNEDYTFTFNTKWSDETESICTVQGDMYETFLPEDDVFVELLITEEFADKDFDVEIYDLKTPENYMSYEGKSIQSVQLPADAALVEALKTKLYVVDNGGHYQNYYYIMLHKPLKEGYYVFNIKTSHDNTEFTAKKLIQVSSLSVYSASLDGETCFWLNDTKTKGPAADAKINMDGVTGRTDKDGKSIIKTAANNSSTVKIDYLNYPTYIYKNKTFDPRSLSAREKYFNYIFTDRKVYKPTDTIDVFGVIRERYGEFKLKTGDKVILKLGDIIEMPVTVDEYGSFNTKLPVSKMNGYSSLDMYLNDELLTTSSVEFMEYPKDKYIISAKSDRSAYFQNENADIDVFVTTYDQSPIEGVEIQNNNFDGKNMITKSDGTASSRIKLNTERENGWQPYSTSLGFSLMGSEDYSQSIYVPVMYLPNEVMLEHEILSGNSVEFTSSLIDRDAIEQYIQKSKYNVYNVNADVYRGVSTDINFTMELYKRTWTRTKKGEKYDFIQKINVPEYDYESKEEVYDNYSVQTKNGKAVVTNLPTSDDPLISYYGEVSFKDKRGREASFTISFGAMGFSIRNPSSIKQFNFELVRKGHEDDWSSSLGLNETGSIRLRQYGDEGNEYVQDGKIMTILTHDKIINAVVGSPQGTPLTFTKDCINTSYVYGAYFDGKYVYPIDYPLYLYFDTEERKLNFEITHDKDSYIPGDEVTATIKVTDKDGKPKKSLVNISVVDEAVFGDNDRTVNFLSRYYDSINFNSSNYYPYASYSQHEFSFGSGGAEKGGGGEDYIIRSDFRDNPAFKSVETDNDGVATITFKLADAVTSWRITAHAVTKDDFVGNTKDNVIATLPYYIDPVMSNEFVLGDEVSVLVKSLGTAYKLNKTEAEYTIEVSKNKEIVYTDTKKGTSYANFNAGKLPEGEYQVLIKSMADGYKDAMEETISVARSGIRLPLTVKQLISSDNPTLSSLDIVDSPVKVTMSNGDISFIMDILYSCMGYRSERADNKAASGFGEYFMDGLYGNDRTPAYIEELKSSLSWSDGIPELTYGDKEPLYIARFASGFPELIRKQELIGYIIRRTEMYTNPSSGKRGLVTDESQEAEFELNRAAGYLALAAAGENVLLEIYDQLAIIEKSENQEKFKDSYMEHMRVLFYGAALCTIGDDSRANELMNQYTASPDLFNDAGDAKEKELRKEYVNTMMAMIHTTINPTRAYDYFKAKESNSYVSDVCEKINFIKKVVPVGGTVSELQYTLNGETKTVKLTNLDRTSLNITKEQFEGLNLKQLSGKTEVNISFNGRNTSLKETNRKIEMKKQIQTGEEYNKEQTEQAVSKNLRYISFDVQMPKEAKAGYYTIRDRVPSNMRFTKSTTITNNENNYYVSNIDKQLVDIHFYYDGTKDNVSVMYNAIQVNDAEAAVGNAYISQAFSMDEIWGESK